MAESDGNAHDHPGAMLGLLRDQVRVYDRLRMLAEKQRMLIASEDTQPLLRILAARQKLTKELEALSRALAPWRADWTRARVALTEAQQREAELLVNKARTCVQDLLRGDAEDARRLQVRKQRVGEELQATRAHRQALSAYRPAAVGAVSSFDRTHDES